MQLPHFSHVTPEVFFVSVDGGRGVVLVELDQITHTHTLVPNTCTVQVVKDMMWRGGCRNEHHDEGVRTLKSTRHYVN